MKCEKEQPVIATSSLSSVPDLMTEDELVLFLRIPEVSKAKDYHNVIRNLVYMRDLPSIEICNHLLYPRTAILKWVEENTKKTKFSSSQQ